MSAGRPMRQARGAVLLAFLLALSFIGIGVMAAADVWSVTRQREREKQLLFVGQQYRAAIRHYYFAGAGRAYPPSLAALLDDDRFPTPQHHLRRLYVDPITGSSDWGLVQVGDRIMGVHSLSDAEPVKRTGFSAADQIFEDKTSYRDWVFAFVAPRRGGGTAVPSTGATTPLPNPPPGYVTPHHPINGNPS